MARGRSDDDRPDVPAPPPPTRPAHRERTVDRQPMLPVRRDAEPEPEPDPRDPYGAALSAIRENLDGIREALDTFADADASRAKAEMDRAAADLIDAETRRIRARAAATTTRKKTDHEIERSGWWRHQVDRCAEWIEDLWKEKANRRIIVAVMFGSGFFAGLSPTLKAYFLQLLGIGGP